MGPICLMVFMSGLLVENGLISGATVFLSRQSADALLRRQKRYNTGAFEEMMKDNLERECWEERCSLEEAREVFENEEKLMEFWVSYIDGDQCESSPCQNGARCEDGMSAYVCWCPVGFNGKNCELEMARQCDINNGDCMHFCVVDPTRGAMCDCATGYRLARDKKTCQPTGEYPCGRLGKSIISLLSRSLNTAEIDIHLNVTGTNATLTNATLTNATMTNATVTDMTVSPAATSSTPRPALDNVPSWAFFPTLPTIQEESSNDQRIVGGDEVTPGEIPWQVVIINKATNMAFCGGSLLSQEWVITAAHCLVEGQEGTYFIRLGEHNLQKKEGTESDHEVAEHHTHPSYNAQRSMYNHDIALLRLHTPVTLSDHALPICLGPKDFTEARLNSPGSSSLVSGWGRQRFGGRESPSLRKVELPFVDRTKCKGSSSSRVSRFMFCAGYSNVGKDSCQGDSGGPHATRFHNTWFLTGIVSWGEECAKDGKYGIYTRVSKYFTWIGNVTGIRGSSQTDPRH